MPPVTVLILAPLLSRPTPDRSSARSTTRARRSPSITGAGSSRPVPPQVVVRREPPDDTPFGARLRRLVGELQPAGLVVLGGGLDPAGDRGRPARVRSRARRGTCDRRPRQPPLLGGRHRDRPRGGLSSATCPDLASDNALPRWLAEVAGVPVARPPARRRLAMDVDSPLDLLLLEGRRGAPRPAAPRRRRGGAGPGPSRRPAGASPPIPGAELLVAGRMSSADLRWLERATRSRTRALIEERGLRTAAHRARCVGRPNRRPPRSVLGSCSTATAPGSLGRHVAALCDGALLDSRVLLAHRLGRGRARLAARRGPLRERPPPRRPGPRPVAGGA